MFSCNISKLIGGLRPNSSEHWLIDTGITLEPNQRLKIDQFDQFVVTCFNKTFVETKFDDKVIYQRAFAGFAKQKVNFRSALAFYLSKFAGTKTKSAQSVNSTSIFNCVDFGFDGKKPICASCSSFFGLYAKTRFYNFECIHKSWR